MTAMAFAWSPPNVMVQNGQIISYTLSCMATTDLRITSVTINQLQFTLDTFIPGGRFQCSVFATNPFGDGPASEMTVSTQSKDTRPIITHIATCQRYMPYSLLCSIYIDVAAGTPAYLSLVPLGDNRVIFPGSDDGISGPIPLPANGFPFWSMNRSVVYVSVSTYLYK